MVPFAEQEKAVSQVVPQTPVEVLTPAETEVIKSETELVGQLNEVVQHQPSVVIGDQGTAILNPVNDDRTVIELPLTEEGVQKGLKHKIIDSIKWLAEWCLVVIRKAHTTGVRVMYKKS